MDFGSMLNKLKRDATVASAAPVAAPAKRSRLDGGGGSDAARRRRRPYPYPAQTPCRTVYLICPPNVQTGGPEAMHQLCHAINGGKHSQAGSTVRARMLYLREDDRVGVRHARGARRVGAYDRYDAPPAEGLPGEEEGGRCDEGQGGAAADGDDASGGGDDIAYSSDLLVWPECWTHLIDSEGLRTTASARGGSSGGPLRRTHQTAIWWLSVDNNNGRFKDFDRDDILHLYQSEYARRYLKDKGAKHVVAMTEYIPDRTGGASSSSSSSSAAAAMAKGRDRDLQVLYNPLKGMHYTDEIRRRSGRGKGAIVFTPIGGGVDGRKRISPEEVASLLRRARIYIDFGPHPGMDRLPREAALAGCIVITNGDGAARYDEDVPIPPQYKIRKFDVDRVHKLLRQSLDDYDGKVRDFDEYRRWIGEQEKRMGACVEGFLEEIVTKRKVECLGQCFEISTLAREIS